MSICQRIRCKTSVQESKTLLLLVLDVAVITLSWSLGVFFEYQLLLLLLTPPLLVYLYFKIFYNLLMLVILFLE